MSNKTLLDSIREKLELLEQGKITYKAFKEFLEMSINALEGVPYEVIKKSGYFEHQFTMAQFASEEECEYPQIEKVIAELKSWLDALEEEI